MHIRSATPDDFEHILRIERADAEVERVAPPEPDALRVYWFGPGNHAYLAERGGAVIAVYRIRPIRADEGAHVANATFVVDPPLRGHGIGARLAAHSVDEARRLGFRAMQFSYVPATRAGSVALWKELGFTVVGTLPGCYRDAQHGDVDAFVLHRELGAS